MTDILKERDKIIDMIQETNNDKLLYAFMNFYDNCILDLFSELDAFEKKTTNKQLKQSIDIYKTKNLLHDIEINIESKSSKYADEKFDKLIEEANLVGLLLKAKPKKTALLILLCGYKSLDESLKKMENPKNQTREKTS